MRNKYLYLLIALLFVGSIFAQTTETFEAETDLSTSFTDNGQVFNITSQASGPFSIANFSGYGWNGTAADNKFIDNSVSATYFNPVQFTIKSAGGISFHLKSIYLFLSQADLLAGSGSCTITGKKAGLTVFTATSSTGFADPTNLGSNNGYTFINLTSYGGADNSNTNIDEYVITTTGTFEYVGLDAMKWEYDCSGLVAPTANVQNFCGAATVANLVATGNSLKWYANASGGSALTGITALTTNTYYVTSSNTTCESARIPVSVTITPSSDNVTTVSTCDSYTWNGTTYTTSGIKTGPTANCVTEKLDLTITPSSDNLTTVLACDSYMWNGTTYTTSGIKTGPTANCVTEKLDLTITPSSDNVTTVSACDSYTWNGTTYTTSGIKTGPTANCVTEKLDLTITPSSNNVTTVSACDSYTWNGTTYTTSGIKTGSTANCVTEKLDLTITPSSNNVTTVSACDSYTWNGITYTTSGIKTGSTANCVTEKLNLTINTTPVPNTINNQVFCNNQVTNAIIANEICATANEGQDIQLTAPAGFVFTSVPFASYGTPNGICDNFTLGSCHAANSVSVIEGFVLGQNSATVSASNGIFGDPCGGTPKRLYVEAAYGTVSWTNDTPSIGLAASGSGTIPSFTAVNSTGSPIVATITVVFNNGTCNSAPQTFTITINPNTTNTTTVSACDSYTWNGTTYTTSGIKTGPTTNCVTEKLDLTITPSSDNVTTVSACDNYTWNGTTYTTSGIKIGSTTNCVTEKLDLTITPSSDNVTTVSACDSYTWNGTTYTISGVKTGPTTNCVTEKLDLTITPSSDNVTTVSACDSYFWNGTTYTTSGVKTGPTANCVTEKLNLTITPSSYNVTTVSACDSYFWNGTTYTTSGVKTGPTTNCVTEKLDLTITPSSDNVDTVSACDSYIWFGTTYTTSGIKTGPTTNCVTYKLDLTITPSSDNVTIVSACDSYTWNGTTYTTSGIKTGPTANCVTEKLDLTINTVDISTTLSNGVLSANALNATYQWVDCSNAVAIPGAVNKTFTPTVTGNYSVIIFQNGCWSTSACTNIITLGTKTLDVDTFKFYPNPVDDKLFLSYSKELTSVRIINMIGQELSLKTINANTAQIDMSNLPRGTYLIEVKSMDEYKTIKVVKK